MAAKRPNIIPLEYYDCLQKSVLELDQSPTYRSCILGVKEYPAEAINCFAKTNAGDRVIIFSIRFLVVQVYQPLLAVYYSDASSFDYVITCIQLYWTDIIRDLLNISLVVVASVSSAHPIFRRVIERLALIDFNVDAEAVMYSALPLTDIVHLFDISSVCHHLEKYLYNSSNLLYFVQVNLYHSNYQLHVARVNQIKLFFGQTTYPEEPHISYEPIVILNSDFFYKYALFLDQEIGLEALNNTYLSTVIFLSRACPYIEFMNTLCQLLPVDDLLNLMNCFRSLKIFLSTAYVVPSTAATNTTYDKEIKEGESDLVKDEYAIFEEIYRGSASLNPRAKNCQLWCDKILHTFNNIITSSLKRVNNEMYMNMEKSKKYISPFDTKLSLYEFLNADGYSHFRNIAYFSDNDSDDNDIETEDNNDNNENPNNNDNNPDSIIESNLNVKSPKKESDSKITDKDEVNDDKQNCSLSDQASKSPEQKESGQIKMVNLFQYISDCIENEIISLEKRNFKRKPDTSEILENKDAYSIKRVKTVDRADAKNPSIDLVEPETSDNKDPTSESSKNEVLKKCRKRLFHNQYSEAEPSTTETIKDSDNEIKHSTKTSTEVEQQEQDKFKKKIECLATEVEECAKQNSELEQVLEKETERQVNLIKRLNEQQNFRNDTVKQPIEMATVLPQHLLPNVIINIINDSVTFRADNNKNKIACTCYAPSTSKTVCPLFNLHPEIGTITDQEVNNFKQTDHYYKESTDFPSNTVSENDIAFIDDLVDDNEYFHDFCVSKEFLGKLRELYAVLPREKSRLWLLQAWLATINGFGPLNALLLKYNIHHIHGSCFNLHHIDHYVEQCNILYGFSFYPSTNEIDGIENYLTLVDSIDFSNILDRYLIRIAADVFA